MKIGRIEPQRIGGDRARRDAGGSTQCQPEVGEITAHAGAIDKGIGGIGRARGNAGHIIDIGVQPIEDRQRAGAAGRNGAELARRIAQELIDRAITAGQQIRQHFDRQLRPGRHLHARRQFKPRRQPDDGGIADGHRAMQRPAQQPRAGYGIDRFGQPYAVRKGQRFALDRLAGSVRRQNNRNGFSRLREIISKARLDLNAQARDS